MDCLSSQFPSSAPLPLPIEVASAGLFAKAIRKMIERAFDIAFVADLALREKQIQQNYRPIIAVHKWFARRPGTLFRSLLLAEFADVPLREAFYQGHSFKNVSVLDPFMGGGTTLLEACRSALAQRSRPFRFLHVSTDEVYGTLGPDDPPFVESTPLAPNSPYSGLSA